MGGDPKIQIKLGDSWDFQALTQIGYNRQGKMHGILVQFYEDDQGQYGFDEKIWP